MKSRKLRSVYLNMKQLCPDLILAKVTDIDLDRLKEHGISGLLFDLDNTLVGYDSDELEGEFRDWITYAKAEGFHLCLVSNGVPKRVLKFAKQMEIPAIIRAFKPTKGSFRRALKLLELKPQQVAMVGDQIFTDIYGANRIGIFTVLITPLSAQELPTTRVVRKVELRVLRSFVKKGWISQEKVNRRTGGPR